MNAIALGGFDGPTPQGPPHDAAYPSRLDDPKEFARLFCFLAETGYMNGETARLDGAPRRGIK